MYLPSCVGDVCWTACVLTALSTSLEALLGVDRVLSAAASAAVAAAYTVTGGMRAVAATDVAQLALIAVGMWAAVPFVLSSQDVHISSASLSDWTGVVSKYR